MRSEVNYIYDAEMDFRAPGSAAVTATTTFGPLKLDKMTSGRGMLKNKLGAEGYDVVIAVSALDTTTGDETYTFSVEVGAAGAAATKVGEVKVTKKGQTVLKLDAHTIEKLDADRVDIELVATLAGTTPSITFAAWLV